MFSRTEVAMFVVGIIFLFASVAILNDIIYDDWRCLFAECRIEKR